MKWTNCEGLENLDFTLRSMHSNCVSFNEFKEWIYLMIENYENLPTYFFDFLDADNLNEIYRLINSDRHASNAHINLTSGERRALYGIAYKRGRFTKENPSEICTEKTALKNLEQNSHILQRFRETFPFIKLDWVD